MCQPEQVYPQATKELAAKRKSLAPKPAEAFTSTDEACKNDYKPRD